MGRFFRRFCPGILLVLFSAVLAVYVEGLPRRPMPVLMYHHIVPDGEACNEMTVTVSKFRQDLEQIVSLGYAPVLPRALAAGDALPEKPILITFDDGYRSNYRLLYPILQEYGAKACISVIVLMPDLPTDNFCTWQELREMTDSGLVEIGSHSYQLHNLDRGGSFDPQGPNGIQKRVGESAEAFEERVLEDIRRSYQRLREELGDVTAFAYPFGAGEATAQALVEELFPVTLMTRPGCADLSKGLLDLPRYTVTMETDLGALLG